MLLGGEEIAYEIWSCQGFILSFILLLFCQMIHETHIYIIFVEAKVFLFLEA